MFKPFHIRTINQPTCEQVWAASGGAQVWLEHGQEVQVWHHGEDGPTLELHNLRGEVHPAVSDADFGHLQTWAHDELVDSIYDQLEFGC